MSREAILPNFNPTKIREAIVSTILQNSVCFLTKFMNEERLSSISQYFPTIETGKKIKLFALQVGSEKPFMRFDE